MREFLEKLQEDQRRMRKYLRSHALHFKRMGDVLARARRMGMRVFVIAEPPLEGVVRLIAEEYFAFLPALPIELQHARPMSVDPDEKPPATAREAGARQAGRHFHKGDVLVAFLFGGEDRETRVVLEAARAKRARILIVAGMGAKSGHTKRVAKVLLALPTRGVKTLCESSFVCARIMARVARASWRASSGAAEELPLVQVTCETCNERVFFEEPKLGRTAICPLCQSKVSVPRESVRRSPRREVSVPATGSRKRKLKPSVMELPTLRLEDLEDDDSSFSEDESLSDDQAAGPPQAVLSDRSPQVDRRISQRGSAPDPCFGSDIVVGSEIVSATPTNDEPDRELASNVTASASPFAFDDDAFMADVQVAPPGSGSQSSHDATSPSRRVSARYTISQCHLRWGRGGYPEDDGPEHELLQLDSSRLSFVLNPDDEAGHTLQAGDELYISIQIPAFLEPILVRASLQEISGTSGNGGSARADLVFQDVDPQVRRKIARASENLGAGV